MKTETKLRTFVVSETVHYEVEARSEEEAEEIFLNSDDKDEFFSTVEDRTIAEAQS
jgi:hypothetical protein